MTTPQTVPPVLCHYQEREQRGHCWDSNLIYVKINIAREKLNIRDSIPFVGSASPMSPARGTREITAGIHNSINRKINLARKKQNIHDSIPYVGSASSVSPAGGTTNRSPVGFIT